MKLEQIVVTFEPDAETGGYAPSPTAIFADRKWTITGQVYPRHLRALAEVSKVLTETDQKEAK